MKLRVLSPQVLMSLLSQVASQFTVVSSGFPPRSEGTDPVLPEEMVMASPEAVAMQDNEGFLETHPITPLSF